MSLSFYSMKSKERSTFFNAGQNLNVLSPTGRNQVLTLITEPKHINALPAAIKDADNDPENGRIGLIPQDQIPYADMLFAHT